jgi:RimJ/RimL family protein N-acetyltransferase
MKPEINIRRVKIEDASLLWEWANDTDVRRLSFNTEPIEYSHHLEWLRNKLQSEAISFWLIELKGVPVAQVRYEKVAPEMAEINFSVSADFRGQGIGTMVLQETESLSNSELDIYRLEAIVLENNPASQRVFEKCGYSLMGQEIREGIACFRYQKEIGMGRQ